MTLKLCANMLLLFSVVLSISPMQARGGEIDCGSLRNHYGPFDYRTASAETRQLVERAHFTPKVELLRGGENWMNPSQDLGYTLNVFPNHHRALMSLINYAKKTKSEHPDGMKISVACRFDRAERFAPGDAVVKSLHGVYLMQKGMKSEATKKLEEALQLAGDNANIYYNLGLAYFDLKDYDRALVSAHKAYRLGFPLPGLRNKLEKAGKWTEPTVARPEGKDDRKPESIPDRQQAKE
ncbi:MAG: tetratricopeptide repeat protein [Sulfuritalea sp.]|nr:tetratricopeptide repeat protein [Sulfuritalea sp.]